MRVLVSFLLLRAALAFEETAFYFTYPTGIIPNAGVLTESSDAYEVSMFEAGAVVDDYAELSREQVLQRYSLQSSFQGFVFSDGLLTHVLLRKATTGTFTGHTGALVEGTGSYVERLPDADAAWAFGREDEIYYAAAVPIRAGAEYFREAHHCLLRGLRATEANCNAIARCAGLLANATGPITGTQACLVSYLARSLPQAVPGETAVRVEFRLRSKAALRWVAENVRWVIAGTMVTWDLVLFVGYSSNPFLRRLRI
ncbi:Hypothetical Protein FCC1311_085982 [Hondaea fermentalgiana]|uniref:Uncharacterized protein n=1 Tax=Hondaea fermentalgiana TaxID=2315210 RepID=A0A2R5GUN4_9STRA|nr:Hypothetical Protein FCC1311_085982 [Hondaea fermentalgiana]|eukprot:GBG32373.1 Hypothetical Protein FCC1311_085982 [Hondaea fermentalgiana]